MVQATQAQTSDALPLQVMLPELQSTSTYVDRPPVVDRANHEVVEPQLQSQVIEPNTESQPISTSHPLSKMLPRRYVGSSTLIYLNEPAALPPPSKKQRTLPEATVSPSVSSQQDMDIDMVDAQLLETFYQDSRHRTVAPGSESSTPPLILMGEHGTLGDT